MKECGEAFSNEREYEGAQGRSCSLNNVKSIMLQKIEVIRVFKWATSFWKREEEEMEENKTESHLSRKESHDGDC